MDTFSLNDLVIIRFGLETWIGKLSLGDRYTKRAIIKTLEKVKAEQDRLEQDIENEWDNQCIKEKL